MAHILAFPTRVSRLYPVFSFVLLLSSGGFLYEWQAAKATLGNVPTIEQRNRDLSDQVLKLTKANSADQIALKSQRQQITDGAAQLAALQKQLADKASQITTLNGQLKNQADQLNANAAELQRLRTQPPLFSFQNQSSNPNVTQQQADVKQLVSDAYGYIKNLYGDPYLLNQVTITFVNEFTISGSAGEIVISNGSKGISMDIHLKSFDKSSFQDINTVIHEMVHAFHGIAVFQTSALEEGMTVAATDAVMKLMEADGKIPSFDRLYLATNDTTYAAWNASLAIPADNTAFYNSTDVSQVYQVIGTAWYRLYQADSGIFRKINAFYYPLVQKGQVPDTAMAQAAVRASISTVNGQPIDAYLATNHAFNPS